MKLPVSLIKEKHIAGSLLRVLRPQVLLVHQVRPVPLVLHLQAAPQAEYVHRHVLEMCRLAAKVIDLFVLHQA